MQESLKLVGESPLIHGKPLGWSQHLSFQPVHARTHLDLCVLVFENGAHEPLSEDLEGAVFP